MSRSYVALVVGAVLALAGCAAATTGALESQAKQKDPHLARLYFIRPAGWMAQGGTINIKINGHDVGGIAHGSYLFVDRPPGTYTLEVAPPFDWANNFQTDVQVAAGNTYYYAITVRGTAVAVGKLGVVDLDQPNPGAPMQSKNGISFATFKLNALDPATGAAEIAKLSAR